jgi:murein DD-endopeptidase MepM/ murein hydrolase activator NlpD
MALSRRYEFPLETLFLTAIAALSIGLGCKTSKGVTWPAFGTYRLPYEDGTSVRVSNDFISHAPDGRYDLKGQGGGPYHIVAAADGWVRFIVDSNTGHGTGDNNYVWIEHPYPYCQPAGVDWPGKPANYDATCVPCQGDTCNEWTKYSHMATDSVTVDAGLSEGDFVTAGTFLGVESDIGHASGDHVHWEVAKLDPDHPLSDAANGWTFDWSGGGWFASPNVLPRICGIGVLTDGDVHTAGPCPARNESRSGIAKVNWTSPWTGASVNGEPATAIGRIALSRPDGRNRVTLSALTLDPGASLVVSRDGVLPLPLGTRLEFRNVRLVREVSFTIPSAGYAQLPPQEIVLAGDMIATVPGLGPLTLRPSGPLPGKTYIAVAGSQFVVYLDVGAAGRLVAVGRFLNP